ncbi:L,D-transpeptidase [Longimicrobium terrae]|uniref:Murein L,D-transpeptidase YcbB/YkuD n=1 Tax=Longimicrobium terrae TaxID=1639882 RepID=A0A841GZ91_9BACT|nr:L,D-transpeptidase [Longimicrobium terrae]MBB4636477.1 murein L,D-transpeptidase YcbB/YkuD [Longimicrobium terrae]MBB6070999.1 murein L,D-transpeptidase YcbB/YkuD [Longimicrobium terrae]NNC29021.1 L,D-transpeptidase [Longimicrobium terrae]
MFSIRHAVPALLAAALATAPAAAQGSMEIVVNVPAGRLDVIQDGARVRSYPVSVGTAGHATPTRQASIRRMVWNPSWTPPDAAWARDEEPASPGWGNPMGRVKIHLFEDYYVHGTPARNERLLGQPASHGCIRMRNADVMELAQLVLRADGAAVSDETVQRLVDNPRQTRELALAGRVRVRVEYRLAEADAESVTLHPDVYARARGQYQDRVRQDLSTAGADPAAALEHLAAAGVPSAPVRLPRVAAPEITPAPATALAAMPLAGGLR